MQFDKKLKILQTFFKINQKELAEKLDLPANTVSQYITGKRTPDHKTILKLLDFGISPLFLFFDEINDPFDSTLESYICAKKLGNENKLKICLDTFIEEETSIANTMSILSSIKGKGFISKFNELVTSAGERMTIILYYFIKDLNEKLFDFSKNDNKEKFIMAINTYEFKKIEFNKHFYILTEKDKKKLVSWVEDNLDQVAIFDIVSNKSKILDSLKRNISILNRLPIK